MLSEVSFFLNMCVCVCSPTNTCKILIKLRCLFCYACVSVDFNSALLLKQFACAKLSLFVYCYKHFSFPAGKLFICIWEAYTRDPNERLIAISLKHKNGFPAYGLFLFILIPMWSSSRQSLNNIFQFHIHSTGNSLELLRRKHTDFNSNPDCAKVCIPLRDFLPKDNTKHFLCLVGSFV